MIKIVLIGCGQIATLAHLPALNILRKQGLIQIAGVCDLELEKSKLAADKFNISSYGTDWKQIVAENNADAISVCLPPGPNAEVSTQAIEMGLHVICEKPPGRNITQAEQMAAAASSHPELVSMIAFNRRFAPLYTRAMEYSLQLGKPHVFYGRFTRPSLGEDPSNTMKDWITSDASHTLDLAVATIGFPHSVSVARQQVGSGSDNVWTIQLHSNQGSAVLLFDFASGRRVERFEWSGSGYDVLLELPARGEWSQRGKTLQSWEASEFTQSTEMSVNYGFLDEYRCFVEAINGSRPRPDADFIYGFSFMQLVKTIRECSSGELRTVPKPNVREKVAETENLPQQLSNGLGFERPVVQILHSPSNQAKYFDLEQLSEVAEHCDLRLGTNNGNQIADITDADVVITGWGVPPLSLEDIARTQRLKLVIVIGASVTKVQPEQLFKREILICNTADAIAQSVAEHCLLLTLAGLRRLTKVDKQMHSGEWPPNSSNQTFLGKLIKPAKKLLRPAKKLPAIDALKPFLKRVARKTIARKSSSSAAGGWSDLQGQVVGLIGWGYTARHFAHLLQPFDCQLLVCSEFISKEELESFNARQASLGEVLGSAKVISLHKGLTEQSKGMIGASELALIQSGSILVNTARGGLIDENALIDRVQKGDIVVALDVFHQEPLPNKHPLRKFDNAILTPHNASSTNNCDRLVGKQALDILLDWTTGKPIETINPTKLARMS